MPGELNVKMVQLMAVGTMYRLTMFLLKKNSEKMFFQLDSNPNQIDEHSNQNHRRKINILLQSFYPNNNQPSPKEAWGQLERWLGHDLLVKAVMRKAAISAQSMLYATDYGLIPKIIMDEFHGFVNPPPEQESVSPDGDVRSVNDDNDDYNNNNNDDDDDDDDDDEDGYEKPKAKRHYKKSTGKVKAPQKGGKNTQKKTENSETEELPKPKKAENPKSYEEECKYTKNPPNHLQTRC